jgi:hypothetical protein
MAPLEVLCFADGWSVETISHGSGRILWECRSDGVFGRLYVDCCALILRPEDGGREGSPLKRFTRFLGCSRSPPFSAMLCFTASPPNLCKINKLTYMTTSRRPHQI